MCAIERFTTNLLVSDWKTHHTKVATTIPHMAIVRKRKSRKWITPKPPNFKSNKAKTMCPIVGPPMCFWQSKMDKN